MAVKDKTAAVDQGGQSHLSESAKRQQSEVPLFVAALKRQGKHLLGEPPVQPAELRFIRHMPEIIVNNGDIPNPTAERCLCNLHRQHRSLFRTARPLEPSPISAECKSEEIADFAEFVPCQAHRPIGTKLKP